VRFVKHPARIFLQIFRGGAKQHRARNSPHVTAGTAVAILTADTKFFPPRLKSAVRVKISS